MTWFSYAFALLIAVAVLEFYFLKISVVDFDFTLYYTIHGFFLHLFVKFLR